jgi:hypothetical protein
LKSGVIIYVVGNTTQGWSEGDETRISSTEFQTDLIEIITTKTGHLDVKEI